MKINDVNIYGRNKVSLYQTGGQTAGQTAGQTYRLQINNLYRQSDTHAYNCRASRTYAQIRIPLVAVFSWKNNICAGISCHGGQKMEHILLSTGLHTMSPLLYEHTAHLQKMQVSSCTLGLDEIQNAKDQPIKTNQVYSIYYNPARAKRVKLNPNNPPCKLASKSGVKIIAQRSETSF